MRSLEVREAPQDTKTNCWPPKKRKKQALPGPLIKFHHGICSENADLGWAFQRFSHCSLSCTVPYAAVLSAAYGVVKGRHIWLYLCNICLVSGTIWSQRIPCKGHECSWFYVTRGYYEEQNRNKLGKKSRSNHWLGKLNLKGTVSHSSAFVSFSLVPLNMGRCTVRKKV